MGWVNTNWITMAQSAGAAEYIDCISAEGKDSSNECPGYNPKQSDGGAPIMQELCEMQSTPSLSLLPSSLRLKGVVPDRVLSMSQIELNCILMLNWIV